jgi:hypothetical protein
MEEVEGLGSPTWQVALGNQPPQAGKITETLETLVSRESTSSQRMHISVGKTRGVRVTTKPKTLFGEVWSGIHTGYARDRNRHNSTLASRARQFTAVPRRVRMRGRMSVGTEPLAPSGVGAIRWLAQAQTQAPQAREQASGPPTA